jgi:hypothetical protein
MEGVQQYFHMESFDGKLVSLLASSLNQVSMHGLIFHREFRETISKAPLNQTMEIKND